MLIYSIRYSRGRSRPFDSVTPLRNGESGPNELVEFRLLVAAMDEGDNYSSITYCLGDEIPSPCGIKLAFSESDVADGLYIPSRR